MDLPFSSEHLQVLGHVLARVPISVAEKMVINDFLTGVESLIEEAEADQQEANTEDTEEE